MRREREEDREGEGGREKEKVGDRVGERDCILLIKHDCQKYFLFLFIKIMRNILPDRGGKYERERERGGVCEWKEKENGQGDNKRNIKTV